jgi:hypothetical protein
MKKHCQLSNTFTDPQHMTNNKTNNIQHNQTQITSPTLNTHLSQNLFINTQPTTETRYYNTQNTPPSDIPESSNARNQPPHNKTSQDPFFTLNLSSMKVLMHVTIALLVKS